MQLFWVEKIQFWSEIQTNKEIIFIDDCSTDGTREKLSKLKKKFGFNLIINNKNKGKGAAIRAGINFANSDYSIIYDADLEYFPEDIIFLLNEIRINASQSQTMLESNACLFKKRSFLNCLARNLI